MFTGVIRVCSLHAIFWTFRAVINIGQKGNFFMKGHQNFFFPFWVFFHEHSWITGLQGKGESISLTPHYGHSFQRRLGISWVITAESSHLHIASSWTWTGNLKFPSASCQPLSYTPLNGLEYDLPWESISCWSSIRFIFYIL